MLHLQCWGIGYFRRVALKKEMPDPQEERKLQRYSNVFKVSPGDPHGVSC